MVIHTVEQMWDAARLVLVLSPGDPINKFLGWIEELSCVDVVAQGDGQVSKSSAGRRSRLLTQILRRG